jgi:hypothetical protein
MVLIDYIGIFWHVAILLATSVHYSDTKPTSLCSSNLFDTNIYGIWGAQKLENRFGSVMVSVLTFSTVDRGIFWHVAILLATSVHYSDTKPTSLCSLTP